MAKKKPQLLSWAEQWRRDWIENRAQLQAHGPVEFLDDLAGATLEGNQLGLFQRLIEKLAASNVGTVAGLVSREVDELLNLVRLVACVPEKELPSVRVNGRRKERPYV